RAILKEAGQGKSADQQEVNAAVGRGTMIFIPFIVFLVGLRLAAALPLYWLVSSAVAYVQQSRVLKEDVSEAEAVAEAPAGRPNPEAVTVQGGSSREKRAARRAKR